MNEEKNFNKTVINWLACIYDVHHLKPLREIKVLVVICRQIKY